MPKEDIVDEVETLLSSSNPNDWYKAFDMADYDAKSEVLKVIFQNFTQPKQIWKNVDYEQKIVPIENILIKICLEIGIKDTTNPFITFISIYLPNNKLESDDLIELNNLYADDIISFGDIAGTGEDKKQHIIFNPNLYHSDEVEYLVSSYAWLSNMYNVEQMNLTAVSKYKRVPRSFKELAKYEDNNNKDSTKRVRNIIMFQYPSRPVTSTINNVNLIERALQVASTYSKEDTTETRSAKMKQILQLIKELNPDELNNLKSALEIGTKKQ